MTIEEAIASIVSGKDVDTVAVDLMEKTLWKSIKRGAKRGAKYGAAFGFGHGLGMRHAAELHKDAFRRQIKPRQLATSTIGGVTSGAAIGAVAGAAGHAYRKWKERRRKKQNKESLGEEGTKETVATEPCKHCGSEQAKRVVIPRHGKDPITRCLRCDSDGTVGNPMDQGTGNYSGGASSHYDEM